MEQTMRRAVLAASLATLGAAATGHAQDFPTRPVRLVVPFSAGGNTDAIARVIGPKVGEALGQTLVVENRPSQSGVVGADVVARATPDGYTLLIHDTTFPVSPTLNRGLPHDIFKDFVPVGNVAGAPTTLVVRSGLPARTLAEVVALAKARPGALSYATGSVGGTAHLAALLFEEAAGIKLNHVPYAGAGQAMNDLVGGHIDITFSALNAVRGLVDDGKVRAIATTAADRLPAMPSLPTFRESGLPEVVVSAHWGIYTAAGTPAPVVAKLNAAFRAATESPEIRAELERRGYVAISNTPEEHARILREEFEKWGAIIRRAGIAQG
jgi:tripartite-type tricarboxylate transporter receptor subunit TctC